MKDALNKAAASPDPAVRAMALSYTEMEAKMEAMAAFFQFYAEGITAKMPNGKINNHTVSTAAPHAVRARAPSAPKNPAAKSVKAEDFTKAILNILYNSSEPVKLPELQMAYEALGLEKMEKESFRQRMHKRQKEGSVVLIPRVGFWPPEASSAP